MHATHSGNALVGIALWGWIPFVFLVFALLPPRRAALLCFLAAWMFLPCGGYEIQAFPEYDKTSAACVGILFSALVFDTGRITRLKPHWLDLFPVLYCVVPFFSSLSNNLGVYDGLSGLAGGVMSWLFPYLIGRLYFSDLQGMRELVLGIFIAGIIYMPFCLWEMRMSPNLHYYVYGFQQVKFWQTYRGSGFRPQVFMSNGLMLSLFMGFTALSGLGLWISRAKAVFLGLPLWIFVVALAVTTVLCRSVGATILFFVGIGSLLVIKHLRTSAPVLLIASITVVYIIVRGGGLWSGMELVDMASATVGEVRAASLQTRIVNETVLAERARERLLLGWRGWGRNRPMDEHSITDGYWIIVFGVGGVLGLAGFVGTILGPALLLTYRIPGKYWTNPAIVSAAVGSLILCLWMVDNIANAMFNPVYLVTAGGLAALKVVKVTQIQNVQARSIRLEAPAVLAAESRPTGKYAVNPNVLDR